QPRPPRSPAPTDAIATREGATAADAVLANAASPHAAIAASSPQRLKPLVILTSAFHSVSARLHRAEYGRSLPRPEHARRMFSHPRPRPARGRAAGAARWDGLRRVHNDWHGLASLPSTAGPNDCGNICPAPGRHGGTRRQPPRRRTDGNHTDLRAAAADRRRV